MTIPHPRPIITTGRLATRMSDQEQAELKDLLKTWAPDAAFVAEGKPLEIELGMGNGMALYERAKANPFMNFIGSEIYLNGLQTLLKALQKHPLSNVRVYPEDARTLFTSGLLQPVSLARVLILFPDPWPKSSHHKRRIVQPELIESIKQHLMKNGELWVVSDWPSYAYHTIATLYPIKGLQLEQTVRSAADCKPSARLAEDGEPGGEAGLGPQLLMHAPVWWQTTKYQEKARIAGRNPWFIKAIKSA
jgi:tRNA (guanine-N(7)-)-methyltransferase